MNLKMKLTASISAFFLVVGLMLMGIMAVNQATVNMGGSINFTATDVYARVTGKIENAQGEYANKELKPLEFSAENGTPDQSEWSGLNLLFDDDATPIVITVKVENLAKDRKLTASLTDNTAINENLVKDLKQDGVTYTSGTTKDLDASTGDGTSTTTYVVTFSIADHNKSLPQMNFDFDIDLMDEGYEPINYSSFGFTFNQTSDTTGELVSYTGTETNVTVPSSYSVVDGKFIEGDTYTITAIADGSSSSNGAFYQVRETLGSVTLPNTIVYIGRWAFNSCSSLTSVSIPSSVTYIGNSAFNNCNSLQPSITDQGVKYLGNSENPYVVLWDGKDITSSSYTVYNDCKIIYFDAFDQSLRNIILPSSLTSIGDYAFDGCTYLTSIDLSKCTSLESIGNYVFSGRKANFTSIDLSQCTSLISIGEYAFYNCQSLTEVDLSNCTSLISIGNDAFYFCIGLTSIDLSDCTSLTSIGSYAFRNCNNLESITLPYPTEWYRTTSSSAISGDSMNMSNPTQNATLLTDTYDNYYFKRNA